MTNDPVYSSSGIFLGYRNADGLFDSHGKKIGHFFDDEIYDRFGQYSGELRNDRLSKNRNKSMKRKSGFTPSRIQPAPRLPRRTPKPIPSNFKPYHPTIK
jgi:hypothetical protein